MSDPENCRLRWCGQVTGPFSLTAILARLDDNEIGVWHEIEVDGTWVTLEEFLSRRERERRSRAESALASARLPSLTVSPPTLSPTPASPAPALGPTHEGRVPPRVHPRRWKVFVLTGLFLGFLGVHNFYAGYRGAAITQLVLTVALFSLGFGVFVTCLWAWIELLVVHFDARGMRLI